MKTTINFEYAKGKFMSYGDSSMRCDNENQFNNWMKWLDMFTPYSLNYDAKRNTIDVVDSEKYNEYEEKFLNTSR